MWSGHAAMWDKLREKLNLGTEALRNMNSRLKQRGRFLLLSAVCLAVLFALGKLNFAVAVNMDGDFLGYAVSQREVEEIVSNVELSVSEALGRSWAPETITTSVALGVVSADRDIEQLVTEALIARVDEVRELQVVYVDGAAVCAFESLGEATGALEALASEYAVGGTSRQRFLQEVVIAAGVVDTRLLEDAPAALAAAVTVEATRQEEETVIIEFSTHHVVNNALYEEEGYVVTPGEDGYEHWETLYTYQNGNLVSRELTNHVRVEPVTQLEVVGGKLHRSTGTYIWPCESGWFSSGFGLRYGYGSSDHQGVDIAGRYNDPIMASDGGVVLFADNYGGYGNLVKIQHENGDITYYAHCSEILVKEGDAVLQGEVIAHMGMTGVANGVHVHFEYHPGGGDAVDPVDYLPEMPYPYL